MILLSAHDRLFILYNKKSRHPVLEEWWPWEYEVGAKGAWVSSSLSMGCASMRSVLQKIQRMDPDFVILHSDSYIRTTQT
jgi:hypothetical protein